MKKRVQVKNQSELDAALKAGHYPICVGAEYFELWENATATLRGNATATLRENATATLRENATATLREIGRASCRERVYVLV